MSTKVRLARAILAGGVVAVLALCPSAAAAPGGLDPTFDGDGRATTEVLSPYEGVEALAVQPDGKIVVVGTSMDEEADTYLALVRYDTDGSLDETFGTGGVQFFASPYPEALAIQSDGKILVAGGAPHDFRVARFNDNGSPDMTFSGDGVADADFEGREDHSRGLAVQADGKIVVVGTTGEGDFEIPDFGIARFDSTGTLDDAFGDHGVRRTNLFGPNDRANAVAIQSDGRIVVAGWTDGRVVSLTEAFAVARYTAEGLLDQTFSRDGKLRTSFGPSGRAFDVAIQADGKIIVGGIGTGGPNGSDFALARYQADGALDTTFSGDGKQRTDFGGGVDEAMAIAIQPNRRILLGGSASPPRHDGVFDFGVARYRPSGKLDLTFSGDGKQRVRFGTNTFDIGNDLALAPNGAILIAGWATLSRTAGYDFGIARLLP